MAEQLPTRESEEESLASTNSPDVEVLNMSDPFELRLHFSNRLRALNPCEDNADEVVSFALRHRELDEDLHSCILEQLDSEENSINVRANIVYFLVDLCELAAREKHYPYICMIERDFPKIIDAAIPLDGMGIVNTNCVRYVLQCLHYEHNVFHTATNKYIHNLTIRQFADTKTFDELMEYLDKRAVDARPELSDVESEADSEPDMSWVKDLQKSIDAQKKAISKPPANGTPQKKPKEAVKKENKSTVTPKTTDPTKLPSSKSPKSGLSQAALEAEDIHDVVTPAGSRPMSLSSLGSPPVPPTPLSPSVASDQSDEMKPSAHASRNFSPVSPTRVADDQPSAGSPIRFSPAASQGVSPAGVSAGSATNLNPAPVNATSPPAFTPVQKEDTNIFTPAYFSLVTQRMEQDRERQRRKEDNSGFLNVSGDIDEEIQQMADNAKEWTKEDFEQMAREKREWDQAD